MKILVGIGGCVLLLLVVWDAQLLRAFRAMEWRAAGARARIGSLHGELAEERTELRAEEAAAADQPAAIADATARQWSENALKRAGLLQQRMQASPRQQIPEMQFLRPEDWALAAALAGPLDQEEDLRRAFAAVRLAAIRDFGQRARPALQAYFSMSGQQLPADLSQLAPYFDPPIDPEILARYRMVEAGNAYNGHPLEEGLPHGGPIEEKPEALADPLYDRIAFLAPGGQIATSSNYDYPALHQAEAAFAAAHPAQKITDPAQLAPYFQDPAAAAHFVDVARAQRDFGGN